MKISADKLMELYVDTLQKCGTELLSMTDSDIEYSLFEEFDIGAISFLHEDALLRLKDSNFINEIISEKSSELRSKFMKLNGTDQWNIHSVRHSREWREVLELSDEVKSLLSQYAGRFMPT